MNQVEMYSLTLQSIACLSENRELCIFLEMVCNTLFSAFSYLDNNREITVSVAQFIENVQPADYQQSTDRALVLLVV